MGVKGSNLLRVTKDRELWEAIIIHVLKEQVVTMADFYIQMNELSPEMCINQVNRQ